MACQRTSTWYNCNSNPSCSFNTIQESVVSSRLLITNSSRTRCTVRSWPKRLTSTPGNCCHAPTVGIHNESYDRGSSRIRSVLRNCFLLRGTDPLRYPFIHNNTECKIGQVGNDPLAPRIYFVQTKRLEQGFVCLRSLYVAKGRSGYQRALRGTACITTWPGAGN